jgi:hypothetical protein
MKPIWLIIAFPVLILAGLLAFSPAAPDLPIYTDALDPAWQDWSYGSPAPTLNFSNSSPVHGGSASIAVTYLSGWSGLQLGYHGATLDVSAYDTLRFWVHGGSTGGQAIQLQIDTAITQIVTPQANAWTQVDVSLLPLGYPRTVYSLAWFNNTAGAQPVFFLDDIAFVDTGAPTPTPPPPLTGPALSVDAGAEQHPISPYIYGMNYASEAIAAELRLPVRRWGGNATSRYNWQNATTNTGSDWYYENVPEEDADDFIAQDRRTGTQSLITMPLIGWVAKQRLNSHPYDCGFKVSIYGPQQSVDPWDTDCGNGHALDGTHITGNNPLDTSLAITSTFASAWVEHLVATFGAASAGGVSFYNLDNEPMLWYDTHRDVHPAPTSYDELRDRALAYAAAIKQADPTAKTLGPVVWGWTAYFWSALDWESGGNWWEHPQDRLAHGNVPFIEWYLQQMQAYETIHGVRLLDYVDVHYYPQADGVSLSPAGSASTQALRLRSTRALWDPTYTDESWIGEPVQLIPRMKTWVAQNYPGTDLAITEYNWGAPEHINGALTQADVLGIFGREGLDLATLWGLPAADQPGMFAFRMYRNYDGLGGAFGQTSLSAASSDQAQLSVYAARRTPDGALTIMVINKTSLSFTSTLTLAGFDPAPLAEVYHYSAADLSAIVHAADQPVTAAGCEAVFPPNSITLFILPPANVFNYRQYVPLMQAAPQG